MHDPTSAAVVRSTSGMTRFERSRTVTDDGSATALPPLIELVDRLERRHADLNEHGARVGAHAERIAQELGLPAPAVARVRLAARLHDIGKSWISPDILDKPAPLTEAEWMQVRRHPAIGARLLKTASLHELADIVVAHHERPDGTGYPHGVPSAELPLEAQIVAVADVYDAMRSPRPYGAPKGPDEARAELTRVASTQLDAHVVAAFLRVLEAAPERAAVASA
jgi:HD-GYP domain-containing protein (c-di-GMP phosphodiesterase class II)